MKFEVNRISNTIQELVVDDISTGKLNPILATEVANNLIDTATEMLDAAGLAKLADACRAASEIVSEHLDCEYLERNFP